MHQSSACQMQGVCRRAGKQMGLVSAEMVCVPQLVGFTKKLAVAAFDALQSLNDFIEHLGLCLQIVIVILDLFPVPPAACYCVKDTM